MFKYSAVEQPLGTDKQQLQQTISLDPPMTPDSPLINSVMNPLLRFRVDSFNSDIFRTSRTNSYIESDTSSAHESILDYISTPTIIPGNVMNPLELNENDVHIQSYNMGKESKIGNNENNSGIGKNKLKIYWIYTRAGAGIFGFLIFFFSNIITQLLFTGSDYWLSAWTDYTERESLNLTFDRNPIIAESRDVNIYIYRFFQYFFLFFIFFV